MSITESTPPRGFPARRRVQHLPGRMTFSRLFALFAWGYFSLLGSALLLRLFFGDRWWWLGVLNNLTLYWFLPLVAVVPGVILSRQRRLWPPVLLGGGIFVLLYGGLFSPFRQVSPPQGATLTVMTYNLLVSNPDAAAVLETIRASDADIVALQELPPHLAEAIREQLRADYPYQVLVPLPDPYLLAGVGVISRYPLVPLHPAFTVDWILPPQVFQIELQGRPVVVVNAHGYPTRVGSLSPATIAYAFELRQREAQSLVDFASRLDMPLVIATDLNATDQNQVYRIITGELRDSWREVGFGLGHTFGLRRDTFDLQRPFRGSDLLPRWLLRIDYIFHSDEWRAVEARTGIWDGFSDHRPVIATLELLP